MQTKNKNLYNLINVFLRVFIVSFIIFIIWVSNFWSEQKSLLSNSNISISGPLVLSSDYYMKYLASFMDDEDIFSSPNFILDILYDHPYVKAARVSHRFPDKIHIEISERTPFARVNNGPDQMIMLDKDSFVIPNIEQIKNYSIPTLSKFNSESELYPIGEQAISVKIKDTIHWLKSLNQKHPDLYHNISEIFLANNDEINLVLAEYPTLIMLGNNNTHYKIDLLKEFEKTIKDKKHIADYSYLDMRYNNQIIAKELNAKHK